MTSWSPEVDDLVGLARLEDRLVRDAGEGRVDLLPDGLPTAWLGQSIEVHGLPAGRGRTVSFALRWHGARPAVLWEVAGSPPSRLTCGVDREWWSSAAMGEALWAAPTGSPTAVDDTVSFS